MEFGKLFARYRRPAETKMWQKVREVRLEVPSEPGVVGLPEWTITRDAHKKMLGGEICSVLRELRDAIWNAILQHKEQSHRAITLTVTCKEIGILAPLLKVLGLEFTDTGIWADKDGCFNVLRGNDWSWWFFQKEPTTEQAIWRTLKRILVEAIDIKRERVRIRPSDLLLGWPNQWLAGESFDPNEQTQILTAVSRTTADVKLIISPSDGEYRLSLQLLTMGLCALYLAHPRRRKKMLQEIGGHIKDNLPRWTENCIWAACQEQFKRGQAEVNQAWGEALRRVVIPRLKIACAEIKQSKPYGQSPHLQKARESIEKLSAAFSAARPLETLAWFDTKLAPQDEPATEPTSEGEPATDQEPKPDGAGPEK